MSISNMTRVEALLADPSPDITLDELKNELNELAQLRDKSRLAFCKRLAIAYMMLVGCKYGVGAPKDAPTDKFYLWARKHLRSSNNKEYSTGTLRSYLGVGFAANPDKAYLDANKRSSERARMVTKIGNEFVRAVREDISPKIVPITKLKEKYNLQTDVAREVNVLMKAWEEASQQARAQFIYMVTGKRVAI